MREQKVNALFSVVERGVCVEICVEIGGIKLYSHEEYDTVNDAEKKIAALVAAENRKE